MSTLTAGGPEVDVHATGRLGELPAAVEVAAYRIAAEAVNNAVRHSRASRVDLSLSAGDTGLEVHVRDDGGGLPAALTPGVGLASMRERATELGGWCTVETTAGGTDVRAWLPYDVLQRSDGRP